MAYEGGGGALLPAQTPEDRLLEVLRRRADAPALRYASPPERVTGGFWAEILAVRLEGAPPELQGDLIVRVMPDTGVAQREIVVQQEVVRQGFPAPRVRLTGGADDGLGRPFMVMDRVPGGPPVPPMKGPSGLPAIGRAALRLPDLMARTSAQLHGLDPAPLRSKLEGLDGALVDIGDLVSLIAERAAGADRPDLEGAAHDMLQVRPPSEREAICHGDLHPFNVLVDGDHVSVIDWSLGFVADPAFDLAFTSMTMAMAPIDIPRSLRGPVRAGARRSARQFLRRYRVHAQHADASLRDDVMQWYTGVHCLRALAEVAEWIALDAIHDKEGHPWLVMAPRMAVLLTALVGSEIRAM